MKIKIISVGHKMPSWVEQACAEYIKRMPREASVELIEIKPDKRAAGKNSTVVQEAEAKRILEACGKDYIVALDERGAEVTTLQLADRMKQWLGNGRDVCLFIYWHGFLPFPDRYFTGSRTTNSFTRDTTTSVTAG